MSDTWTEPAKVATDDDLESGYFNGIFKEITIGGKNLIRSLIDRAGVYSSDLMDWWGDAYIDSNGRENSVNTTETFAEFDTNKYQIPNLGLTEYVIIEATSYSGWSNGNNDTNVTKISDGKWLIYCDTGTDAVQRAQIHKSLWYGTNGTNQLIDDFTGVTAVKTSHSNDVGKQAHFIAGDSSWDFGETITGTFSNTSTNTDCSSWSAVNGYVRWEIPSGTTKNTSAETLSDEFGTDRSADEVDNPTNCQLEQFNNTGTEVGRAIVLCVGDITWVASGVTIATERDFYSDDSIPLLTAAESDIIDEYDDGILINHTIPSGTFSSTISHAIGTTIVEDWETGADIQFKLTNANIAESIDDAAVASNGDGSWTLKDTYMTLGTIPSVGLNMKHDGGGAPGSTAYVKVVYNYDDGTNSEVANDTTSISYVAKTFTHTSPTKFVESVQIYSYVSDGGTVSYKDVLATVTDAYTDDSGWLDYNAINNFTAFTVEPKKMIVKLIPKTSPTAGYPSIRGFTVRAW